MKVLQWSMTIPESKQKEFVDWFNKTAGPILAGFGAKKHEVYKVEDKQTIGRQIIEENRFIERVYFDDDFNIVSYFARVKENPDAWKVSRMYEGEFGAKDIELRVLIVP